MTAAAEAVHEREIASALRSAIGDRPILLCGSRATGEASADSDYDVAVVVPLHALPLAMGRLRTASRELTARLGVAVTANPLPARHLRAARPPLFVWKALVEGRLLHAPAGFRTPPPGAPSIGPRMRFSYLLSAAMYLLAPVAAGELVDGSPGLAAANRKALRHLAQVRLLEGGRYAPRLVDAVALLGDARLAAAAAEPEALATWRVLRDQLLDELSRGPDDSPARALLVNAQYASLGMLRRRRRRWLGAFALRAADRRLGDAAVGLLVDLDADADAARGQALARRILAELPDAHPLMGL
jgi:predicted nucleotidyltransferase